MCGKVVAPAIVLQYFSSGKIFTKKSFFTFFTMDIKSKKKNAVHRSYLFFFVPPRQKWAFIKDAKEAKEKVCPMLALCFGQTGI